MFVDEKEKNQGHARPELLLPGQSKSREEEGTLKVLKYTDSLDWGLKKIVQNNVRQFPRDSRRSSKRMLGSLCGNESKYESFIIIDREYKCILRIAVKCLPCS